MFWGTHRLLQIVTRNQLNTDNNKRHLPALFEHILNKICFVLKTTKMRTLIFFIFFFAGIIGAGAQEWLTDWDIATAKAAEQNRRIIMVFQGSDWCAPCMKLERQIWSSGVFKKYAKEHYILVKVDFPRRRKNKLSKEQQAKNNLLAEKYNPQGIFPLVVVFNSKGQLLGTTGYKKMEPQEYIELLNSF